MTDNSLFLMKDCCTSLQFANKTNAKLCQQYNWTSCYLL